MLRALGVPALHGRLPLADEDRPGAPRVVVLSHAFWQGRLGGRADVIGSTMQLDGEPHQVIGIMPPGFRLPATPREDVWPILQLEPALAHPPFWLRMVVRLEPTASFASLASGLDAAERAVKQRFPDAGQQWQFQLQPLREYLVRDARRMMLVLADAVLLVLALAAANVANLLLGRIIGRSEELA